MEIMRAAGRDVCGGLEIGVDVDLLGARYRDKRGGEMWETMMHTFARSRRNTRRRITLSNVHFVMRHGRRIEVETVDTPGIEPIKRKNGNGNLFDFHGYGLRC